LCQKEPEGNKRSETKLKEAKKGAKRSKKGTKGTQSEPRKQTVVKGRPMEP
jgi:hypothetical protein